MNDAEMVDAGERLRSRDNEIESIRDHWADTLINVNIGIAVLGLIGTGGLLLRRRARRQMAEAQLEREEEKREREERERQRQLAAPQSPHNEMDADHRAMAEDVAPPPFTGGHDR